MRECRLAPNLPSTPRPRPLDLSGLVCFETVARLGSLSAAAASLHIATSALSRRVRQLEDELGVAVFERLPRGMRLTSAGEVLLHHARLGFQELTRARGIIEEMRGLKRGHVRLVVVESAMRGPVVAALSEFWRSFPGVEVDVKVVRSTAAARLVETGEAELAVTFAARPRAARLEAMAEAGLRMGAVMRPDHELARETALRLRDLAGHPVLLADPTLMLHDAVRATDELDRMFPRPRFSSNSITLMSLLAVHGAGIALKTRLGIEAEIGRGELVFVPLSDTRLPVQRLVLWARRGLDLSRAARALAACLAAALTKVSEI